MKITRKKIKLFLGLTSLIAIPAISSVAKATNCQGQVKMTSALKELAKAKKDLQAATKNKGPYLNLAISLIDQTSQYIKMGCNHAQLQQKVTVVPKKKPAQKVIVVPKKKQTMKVINDGKGNKYVVPK